MTNYDEAALDAEFAEVAEQFAKRNDTLKQLHQAAMLQSEKQFKAEVVELVNKYFPDDPNALDTILDALRK